MLDPKIVGRRIKYFRQRNKISQLALENAIEGSVGFISRIENGLKNPSKETIKKIVKALNLTFLESEYLYGAIFEPASDAEIQAAQKEVEKLFENEKLLAYMVDDRTRIVAISKGMIKFLNLPENVIKLINKEHLYKVVFAQDSPIRLLLAPDKFEEMSYNLLLKLYIENGFMFDDESFKDLLNFIKSDPLLLRSWEKASHTDTRLIFHTSEYRIIDFLIGKEIKKYIYSVEPLQKFPRFQIVEYTPLSK